MKPGTILTERETQELLARLKKLSAAVRPTGDTRAMNQLRLATLAVKKGAGRAARYNREQEALLAMLNNIQ